MNTLKLRQQNVSNIVMLRQQNISNIVILRQHFEFSELVSEAIETNEYSVAMNAM